MKSNSIWAQKRWFSVSSFQFNAVYSAAVLVIYNPLCFIAMSDSNGYIVDENGIDYKVIQEIKEVKRRLQYFAVSSGNQIFGGFAAIG